MEREIILSSNEKKLSEDCPSSTKLKSTGYKLEKDIVLYVLNMTLLKSGTKVHDMVNRSLYEKYHSNISECFENPEFLCDVLRFVFDDTYDTILESIVKNLERFSQESGIKEFLDNIRKN